MGIRYYAYPLAPELLAQARTEPHLFLSHDPLADAWELNGTQRPDMLYLDKCWEELQRLTCPRPATPRPAYALVRGAVTHTPIGWIPWFGVLSPPEVDDVARDLAMIDEDDVDAWLGLGGAPPSDGERSYVLEYLRQAQKFTSRMQRRGWGVVYMIG